MSALEQNIAIGFKQTEVGIFPKEWQILTIDEAIASKMILDQMDGNHGELYPKSHEFKDDGIPYIGATDFYSGKIDYKHCKRLPLKRAKLFKKGVAKDGDVLFAHNATVGPSSLVETHEDFIIISTTATYYRCNGEEIKNTYLLNFFRSKLFESQYSSVMSQSTRNQVPILAQRKFYLALPHIKEQTSIANALSDVDALLTELEKLIAKKQAIKTATMQQLLTGKTRLPQFATYTEGEKQGQPKGTKPSELGEIPEDWDEIELGEVFNFKNGLNKEKEFFGYGTPIVNYMDVYNSNGITAKKVNGLVSVTPLERKNYSAKKGDVFFTRTSETTDEIGLASVLLDSIKDAVFSGFVLRARQTKKRLENDYMKYCFRDEKVRKQIQSTASYTTRALTNGQLLSKVIVLVPSSREQTAIATILSDMDCEIQTLEQRLAKTRQIKQGMMQELLTGRTRLPFKKES